MRGVSATSLSGPRASMPPGPRAPAWLQLVGTWTRPTATLEGLRSYGSRVTVRLPFQPPFVVLSDPAEVKELFAAPPEVLHPGEGAWVLEPIIGRNSVILLDESAHLTQRRLLLPAFHGERMQGLVNVMTELTERELDSWPVGRPVELHPRLQNLTLEIILRAVFGLDRGPRLDSLREALTEVLSFSESPLSVLPALQRALRWTPTMKRFRTAMAKTDELMFNLIEERRAEGAAGDDVLAVLLSARHEDGSPMSRQELRDELMTALVAGHETTASQLAWALERLAHEPAVVARLATELDGGQSGYLDATVTEILRLRPVLPNAEPRLVKRPVTIGGVEYPPGIILLASAFLIHHDPAIYPEPYAFRPERFLEAAPGSFTWIPFGGGRRRCLGASFALQEMKIVLREVVRRFTLSAAAAPETTRRRGITFSPRGGATVVLGERAPVREPLAELSPAPA
jgi:cytochrome P450